MATRICGACRTEQVIEWAHDGQFGPRAEAARCPRCATLWGVRERRAPVLAAAQAGPATRGRVATSPAHWFGSN